MRKQITILIIALATTFTTLGQTEEQTVKLNVATSSINWYGYYLFYFGGHEGTVQFKDGEFKHVNGKLTGGSFVIDMTTISSTDIENKKGRDGLDKHLKNQDFFETNKYPLAKVVITHVDYETATRVKIYADMTIKGKTKPINFRAEIDIPNKKITTKFKIDRTRWGVEFNHDVKDNAISDAIGFEVTLGFK